MKHPEDIGDLSDGERALFDTIVGGLGDLTVAASPAREVRPREQKKVKPTRKGEWDDSLMHAKILLVVGTSMMALCCTLKVIIDRDAAQHYDTPPAVVDTTPPPGSPLSPGVAE